MAFHDFTMSSSSFFREARASGSQRVNSARSNFRSHALRARSQDLRSKEGGTARNLILNKDLT